MKMNEGIPLQNDYEHLYTDDDFLKMKAFSDSFVSRHSLLLKQYSWVIDSFRQWSRQWEYVFVYKRLKESFSNMDEPLTILDAGSGATFFAPFLAQEYQDGQIHCTDFDDRLAEYFKTMQNDISKKISFSNADLRKLPFQDSYFDVVYCISTLEHTDNYSDIINEFRRVLKPNGRLILTFDISLDGQDDISIDESKQLIQALSAQFNFSQDFSSDAVFVPSLSQRDDIVRVSHFLGEESNLLPWKFSVRYILSSLKRIVFFKKPKSYYKDLSFACFTLDKK